MENIHIQIHDYNYNIRQYKKIKTKLELLIKQIPYHSKILLDIEYKNKKFIGKLKCLYNKHNLFVLCSHYSLHTLMSLLYKKMQKQILKQKQTKNINHVMNIKNISKFQNKIKLSYKQAS